jgi:hypothetical protein
MKKLTQVVHGIVMLGFSAGGHAITLNYSDLPDQIQADVSPAYVGLRSMVDTSFSSAFYVYHGGELNWLIRYSLDPASSRTTIYEGFDGVVNPYSGYIWLEAPVALNLTGENYFRVYTDQITPNPDLDGFSSGGNQSTWIFGMSADTARAGSASAYIPYDQGLGGSALPSGNMNIVDGFFTCIECEYIVSLNLVGLQYDASGNSVIDSTDTTALLLSYNDFDPLYSRDSTTRNFYVQQPVPVPAAVWLFGSGLLAMFGFAKRRKH